MATSNDEVPAILPHLISWLYLVLTAIKFLASELTAMKFLASELQQYSTLITENFFCNYVAISIYVEEEMWKDIQLMNS